MKQQQPLIKQSNNMNDITAQRCNDVAILNNDKMNTPIRKPPHFQIESLFLNLFQLFALYFLYGALFPESETDPLKESNHFNPEFGLNQNLNTSQSDEGISWTIIFPLGIYAFLAYASYSTSDVKKHLDNLSRIAQLRKNYEQMRNSTVMFTFKIQCFHMQRKGEDAKEEKVVTHTAEDHIKFSQCYDFSGFLKPQIQKEFKYQIVFIDYLASYEFLQDDQKLILDNMYQDFITKNARDTDQEHSKTFKFSSMKEKSLQAYLTEGEDSILPLLLKITAILNLSWIMSMALEIIMVERYEVKIVKKIKLDENQGGYKKLPDSHDYE